MKKALLLMFACTVCVHSSLSAQDNKTPISKNTYRLEVQGITNLNLAQATSLLTQLTAAETISYDATRSVFTLTSSKELDKNIIAGKMQKNYFPVLTFQKAGEAAVDFPKLKNTGNAEADALNYDQKKAKWIAENPAEYEKMISNPSTATTPNN